MDTAQQINLSDPHLPKFVLPLLRILDRPESEEKLPHHIRIIELVFVPVCKGVHCAVDISQDFQNTYPGFVSVRQEMVRDVADWSTVDSEVKKGDVGNHDVSERMACVIA
jgi:hypothetical protein